MLLLICYGRDTVEQLAEDLKLTDNAVRAQLQRLERDGLASKRGLRPGVRRPHVRYELTPKARLLFPRAYEPVLRTLVDVVTEQVPARASTELLLETGRRLLRQSVGELRGGTARQRIASLIKKLNGHGVGIELIEDRDGTVIRSCSCPLASVTAAHPEMCGLLATLLGDLLGTGVAERCDRRASPRCCFEVMRGASRGHPHPAMR
jgi:predicted ArsR family transcriptional regulator